MLEVGVFRIFNIGRIIIRALKKMGANLFIPTFNEKSWGSSADGQKNIEELRNN